MPTRPHLPNEDALGGGRTAWARRLRRLCPPYGPAWAGTTVGVSRAHAPERSRPLRVAGRASYFRRSVLRPLLRRVRRGDRCERCRQVDVAPLRGRPPPPGRGLDRPRPRAGSGTSGRDPLSRPSRRIEAAADGARESPVLAPALAGERR